MFVQTHKHFLWPLAIDQYIFLESPHAQAAVATRDGTFNNFVLNTYDFNRFMCALINSIYILYLSQ